MFVGVRERAGQSRVLLQVCRASFNNLFVRLRDGLIVARGPYAGPGSR